MLLIFLSFILFVYFAAALILFKRFLIRFRHATPRNGKFQLWFARVILSLAAIGIVCFSYARFVEPYWLSVTHVNLSSPKLPPGSKAIRVVQISDLHSDPKARLENRLPEAIAAENPDIIVFTGDSINSPAGLPIFRECIAELAKIAPTFVVKGNWDSWYWNGLDLFGETGATELDGNSVRVEVRGVPIWVVGLAVEHESRIDTAFSTTPSNEFKLFLYHYPDLIKEVAQKEVDLYCAGHTHGGQIALPLYGALITFSKYGKKYEAGLYKEGKTTLYVNRGIGMEGGFAPRVRFWSRPEVTVIDIGPTQ